MNTDDKFLPLQVWPTQERRWIPDRRFFLQGAGRGILPGGTVTTSIFFTHVSRAKEALPSRGSNKPAEATKVEGRRAS